jgi:hypothetical protein
VKKGDDQVRDLDRDQGLIVRPKEKRLQEYVNTLKIEIKKESNFLPFEEGRQARLRVKQYREDQIVTCGSLLMRQWNSSDDCE